MNTLAKLFTALLFIPLFGCGSTNNISKKSSSSDEANNTVRVTNLHNHIEAMPRLTFSREGEVINTSVTTFSTGSFPLFVLDGIQIGRSFRDLINLLDQNQFVSVEFLKSRRATVRYGEEGRNGVILIKRG